MTYCILRFGHPLFENFMPIKVDMLCICDIPYTPRHRVVLFM